MRRIIFLKMTIKTEYDVDIHFSSVASYTSNIYEHGSDKRGLQAFKYILCYSNLKTIYLKYFACSDIHVKLL